VTSLEQPALLRALGRTIELLLRESAEIEELPARIRSELRDLGVSRRINEEATHRASLSLELR